MTKTYPPAELNKSFKAIFGVDVTKFPSVLEMAVRHRFTFDVVAFDEWLGKTREDYKPSQCLMLKDGRWVVASLADYAKEKGFYDLLVTLMNF